MENSKTKMNILEAYIKKYNQFIILILGLPCSNKSKIAKELHIDLKLPIIKINDYLKPNKYITKEVDNIKFKLYEHPDIFDWDKLNDKVNELKSTGVILYGNYIDIDNINFNIDYSFFINMNTTLCKNILIEKKLLQDTLNENSIKIYFEKIFNPLYEELKQKISINKFFNIKEKTTFDEIYDSLFDILMDLISKKLK